MYKFKLYDKRGNYIGSSSLDDAEAAALEILQSVSQGVSVREQMKVRPVSAKSFSVETKSDYFVLTRIG